MDAMDIGSVIVLLLEGVLRSFFSALLLLFRGFFVSHKVEAAYSVQRNQFF